ncbi:MAG: hypothetical protein IPN44_09975 [Flavobacteriales bacterium]|nr:hypothetical protein [Flavobacteriales bacterium]
MPRIWGQLRTRPGASPDRPGIITPSHADQSLAHAGNKEFIEIGMVLAMGDVEIRGMNRVTLAFVIGLLWLPLFTAAAAPLELSSKAVILRVERVGPEALGLTAGTQGETFVRIVAKAGNGKYLVAVNSNAGILRMQGAYLDSALAVQDGVFTYYHPNGRMESEGRYVAGIKSGTWVRYAIDGARLSERNYLGLPVDQLIQGQQGVGASANSVVNGNGNGTLEPQRRQISPVQF